MSYDVVIIGGSLSGAATATLLRRESPNLRILIIERAAHFTRRVGEATVEISGYFLGRVMGLASHLNNEHLIKQGMRFWFANGQTQSLEDSSEIGPKYHVRLPSWQLDRSVVDEELLQRAVAGGVELRRPAQVTAVRLSPGGEQEVDVKTADGIETIRCRWVVDASGAAAMLARQEGWLVPNTEHPTAAAWARWRGVKDWDGRDLSERFPMWAQRCLGSRNTATNHIVGDGWWSWWIPLKGGDVSVGVVFDQRLVKFPQSEAKKLGDRIHEFLAQHPVAREMLSEAEWIEGDVHWRKNLAYHSRTFAGDGFALVGDAAAFLDPLYSPGMDVISFTSTATAALIAAQQRGEALAPLLEQHNARFTQSYRRWFEAIYKDKYEYLGEYDLMHLAFRMDLGLYYLGIVSQPFKYGASILSLPPFSVPVSTPVYHFMRFYNARFAAMARKRRERRVWGRGNSRQQFLFQSFSISPRDLPRIAATVAQWLLLELTEGWRSWFGGNRTTKMNEPVPNTGSTRPVEAKAESV
ncbi:FAD dependent oxidoreductase [Chthoniobacter flavus Ellin428]|uniref:FAD dependent oxidoreductase n=1 Tax=Chthoniobacter flavus Ellin428 TaxID=497964 RepID=B4CW90_9BACT|nr:NAD(P)/FAD-dependent oxidoreductase [Chthoniobacter flavus]EDY21682.1 FAD dependent oxidoreductase [Chthoniobacter flavus Ellin428]TCO95620.1 flavin-dependent dehydrogenase [Chthoniobacter flavus]